MSETQAPSLLRRLWSQISGLGSRLGDLRLGIRTHIPRPAAPSADARYVHYEPLGYRALQIIARRIAPGPGDVVCDAGCGMGRVVCFFARLPLAGCVGVEFDEKLVVAARRNVARMRGRKGPVQIVAGDAAAYDYAAVSVITMYNPFGQEIMRNVLRAVLRDRTSASPPLRIVYANPVQEAVFAEFPELRVVERFDLPYGRRGSMPAVIWEHCP